MCFVINVFCVCVIVCAVAFLVCVYIMCTTCTVLCVAYVLCDCVFEGRGFLTHPFWHHCSWRRRETKLNKN